MTKFFALASLVFLVACGGGGYKSADRYARVSAPSTASGPISRACMASDRKARSSQLCGCIQAVANMSLSSRDQSLAASFYRDPQKAQDIRQSDNPNNERFWKKYREYADTSEQICG
ncbi:arginine transporter [Lentibacter sp. XHP0401]|jgi:hypothetical protein|uniref:arginine transporter n=1 Tax=Lentibacter sp. XHP0401 TaxID=2984334 RepID=UPI0021E95342|nr:arginine transporter [Lentibacter sp. XHP0401]MCV2893509.1 arginine transporter [Lentibacter sp. XHP0401]